MKRLGYLIYRKRLYRDNICIKAPYPRRFLGRVVRTPPYHRHSLGDGSKCHRGKGLKTVFIAPMRTSEGSGLLSSGDLRPQQVALGPELRIAG